MGEASRFAVYVAGVPVVAEEFLRRIAAEGVPSELAERVLAQVPCPIKRNAPLETAQRYQAMFRRAGAVVDVLPEPFVAPEPFAPVPEVDSRGSFVIAAVPEVPGPSRAMPAFAPIELDGEQVPSVDERGTLEVAIPDTPGLSRPMEAFLPPPVVALDTETVPEPAPPRDRPPIELPPPRQVAKHGPIKERLQHVLPYLGRTSTVLTLTGAAVLAWIGTSMLAFLPIVGWVLAPLFAISMQAIVFFRIIETTAYDDDELDPPDFTEMWSDLWLPALRYIAIFLPVILCFLYLGYEAMFRLAQGHPPWQALLADPRMVVVAVVGIILLPLMAAITAITRSVFPAYNPVRWYASLRAMGSEYPIAAVTFYTLYVTEAFATVWVSMTPFARIPLLGGLVLTLVGYFFLAARARVLGALCQPYVDRV